MVLGRYLGCDPTELMFNYGVYGKPRLGGTRGQCGWQFNVAHSYTRALIAVAYDRAVGVDIEYVRPIANIDHVIKDVCSVNEQAWLQTLSPQERSREFFECWTRKEAIVKAAGRGLIDTPNQIDVISTNEHVQSIMISDGMGDAAVWDVRALAPGPGYVGMIAAQGQDWHPVYREWCDAAASTPA
jgi:4'-phosphopantetheinyl transferase